MWRYLEDLFITRLYSSGVLRYAENDSDMDFGAKFSYTAKGPNALGNNDNRRIATRQRTLHPSMLGYCDCAASSSSDPGRSGSLSPYCDMKSMYFDDSLYENQLHYKLSKLMDNHPLPEDWEEIHFKASSEEEYNKILDELFHAGEGKIKLFGVSNNPMEIIVEKDPRDNYRKFNEDEFLMKKETEDKWNKH